MGNWDKALQKYHIDLQLSSDSILLGRKMAMGGFFGHWESVASNPDDPQYAFEKPITEKKKYVFTKTLQKSKWQNTELITCQSKEQPNGFPG